MEAVEIRKQSGMCDITQCKVCFIMNVKRRLHALNTQTHKALLIFLESC